MLLNYLELSLRLLARNPYFTIINVVGLAIDFAVFFILLPLRRCCGRLQGPTRWRLCGQNK